MSDFESLIFYILSFLLSAGLYAAYCKKDKKIFLIGAAIIPLLIGGLRYNVGTDYMSYYDFYKNSSFIDPGFYFISSVARYFGSYQLIFFIYNLLTLLFVFLGLKNLDKQYRPIAYLCFLFLFFTVSFNAIRQMLAVSIVFFSYKYAINKRILPFVMAILFATIFHTTAIFGIILYPLLNLNKKFMKVAALIIMLVAVLNYQNIVSVLVNLSFFDHFSSYESYVGNATFSNMSFFADLLVLAYLVFAKKRASERDPTFRKYLFIYIIGIILSLTGFSDPYVKRIALYFTITSVALLSIASSSYENKKNRLINQMIVVIFVISKFIIQIYLLGQADIIPYNFIGV